MKYFYSQSKNAFFADAVHGDSIPADAVALSGAEYTALLSASSKGKLITVDASGRPVAVEQTPTLEQMQRQVERLRAQAYQAEADPLFFKAQRGEATMDEWRAKIAEIKARFPDPAA